MNTEDSEPVLMEDEETGEVEVAAEAESVGYASAYPEPPEGGYMEAETSEAEEAELEAELRRDGGEVPEHVKKRLIRVENSPVEMLLLKLEAWLLQQPEWGVILAAPRATRRRAINLLAKRLVTIPNRYRGV
jgi:hypothetical protein